MLLPCGQSIKIDMQGRCDHRPTFILLDTWVRKVQLFITQLVNDRAEICTQVSASSCFDMKLPPSFKWVRNDGLRERDLDLSLDISPSFQIKGQRLLPGFLGTFSAWKDRLGPSARLAPKRWRCPSFPYLAWLSFPMPPPAPHSHLLCCQVVAFLPQVVGASTWVPFNLSAS